MYLALLGHLPGLGNVDRDEDKLHLTSPDVLLNTPYNTSQFVFDIDDVDIKNLVEDLSDEAISAHVLPPGKRILCNDQLFLNFILL
jgi:hypothetical protein